MKIAMKRALVGVGSVLVVVLAVGGGFLATRVSAFNDSIERVLALLGFDSAKPRAWQGL